MSLRNIFGVRVAQLPYYWWKAWFPVDFPWNPAVDQPLTTSHLRAHCFAQELRNTDVEKVGGKSASLGEMISQLSDVGVPVPGLSAVRGLDLMDLEINQSP